MAPPVTAGVDGSNESRAALAWAAREAERRRLPLHVVHAWRFEVHEAVDLGDRDAQEQRVHDMIDKVVREVTEHHRSLEVTCEVAEGRAVDVLTAASAEAQLLVLGSRGHGVLVGFLVGSVGQQVIAQAARPVVLVRADDPAAEAAGRDIVVGQQGGPDDTAQALRFAFETAAARGAGLRAVRAWTLPPAFAYSPGSLELLDEVGGLESFERTALEQALRPWRERFPHVPVTQHVEMGSAGQVLLAAAEHAQLMVVGRRACRTAVGARIGSVAHGVLHHAPCPVAVVPPG